MKEHLNLILIGPDIWEPRLAAAAAILPEREARFCRALIELAHSRHLGLPIELAVPLVPLVLGSETQPASNNPWAAVFSRLQDTLNPGGRLVHGLVFSANPSYVVMRLVMPLMLRLNRVLGRSFLFCEEPINPDVRAGDYAIYAKQVLDALRELTASDEHALFWQELALSLSAFSRHRNAAAKGATLPSLDGPALGMLLRFEAGPDEQKRQQSRLRQVVSRHKQRRTVRAREGGIDGIHLTRRPEDLDSILLSEFTNPDFLLTDRLLNTGYFSLERSPRREKLRDAFVAAIMPGSFQGSLTADFARAAWFECATRLSHMLRRAGLDASAFCWMEGDRRGRLRVSNFYLEDMPAFAHVADGPPTPAWRRQFLTALGWVPHLLEPNPAEFTAPDTRQESDQLLAWMYAAWQHVREGKSHSNGRLPPKMFSFLHLMVFLPHPQDEPGENLHHLINGFALGNQSGRHASITYIPLQENGPWSFQAEGHPRKSLLDESESSEARSCVLSSALVSSWMDQLTKEIWRA